MITRSYIDGYSAGEARVNMKWLNKNNVKGLIAISAYHEGIIQSLMLSDKENEVEKQVSFLKTHFDENFFLALLRSIEKEKKNSLVKVSHYLQSIKSLLLH